MRSATARGSWRATWHVDALAHRVDHRELEGGRESRRELTLGGVALLDREAAEPLALLAALGLQVEQVFELGLGENALVHEHFAQPATARRTVSEQGSAQATAP